MYRIISIFFVTLMMLGCGNKPKVISDEEMSAIIRDIIITNAYSGTYVKNLHTDTIDIYTPILNKYGYTDRDFRYTLAKLQMKKSARITEILDVAIADITAENNYFTGRKIIREKIDSIVLARYKDTVYVKDTAKLKINALTKADKDRITLTIPVKEGTYSVKYSYYIDSTDKNNYSLMRYTLMDSADVVTKINALTLYKGEKRKVEFKVDAGAKDRKLVIKLAEYNDNSLKPKVTFDSIYVIYNQPMKEGRKRLTREILNYDEFFNVNKFLKPDSTATTTDSLKALKPKKLWQMVY